jgi:hypothetical protein
MSKALKKRKHSILTHTSVHGYQGSVPYLKPKKALDNTGRHHVVVYTELAMHATKNFY